MRTTGHRCVALLFLAFFAIFCLAKSGGWWDEKPIVEWSTEQVYDFLSNSPWVGGSQGYFRQAPWISGMETDARKAPTISVSYQARIISARPVREAFLQLSALNPAVVTAKSLRAATAAEELRHRIQELLTLHPNDLLVKGDETHVILAISQRVHNLGIMGEKSEQEVFNSDELYDVDQSSIVVTTKLATDTGKHVELANYQPPGSRGVGAMYYFLRNLPDGTPLVTSADKELFFESVINKKPVKIKFDIGKLKYKGKLEL